MSERRLLLGLLLALTCALVGLFAYDRSTTEDFWLAGVALGYGVVLARLFWTEPPPEPEPDAERPVHGWSPLPPTPPPLETGDTGTWPVPPRDDE